MLPATSVHCYRCGNTYQFIGSDVHPGVCPRCGSRIVSPSGDLALGTPEPIHIEGSTSAVDHIRQVVALDDSAREFRYVFVLDDESDRAYLTCVTVAGVSVQVEDAISGRLAPMGRLNDLFDHLVTVDDSSPLYEDDAKPDYWREGGA